MMRALATAAAALLAATFATFAPMDAARAEAPPPVAWEITGTSSTALPVLTPSHRVERRLFQKADHIVVRTGFSYLSRGDFYSNPGLTAEATWYPTEAFGVDLLSATAFFSTLNSTALALRTERGLLPDSQRPLLRLGTGARFAFAYGKLLLEQLDTVVHLDASVNGHLGMLLTDRAPNAMGDVGLTLQAQAFERLLVWVEASWLLSYEARSSTSFASGPMATVGLGLKL